VLSKDALQTLSLVEFAELSAFARKSDLSCKWFLFGSLLNGKGPIHDVDLLAVVPNDRGAVQLRKVAADHLKFNPIHLTIMTQDEEKEMNFVFIVGAASLQAI
jgi:predicted nucleotidyltransferase